MHSMIVDSPRIHIITVDSVITTNYKLISEEIARISIFIIKPPLNLQNNNVVILFFCKIKLLEIIGMNVVYVMSEYLALK